MSGSIVRRRRVTAPSRVALSLVIAGMSLGVVATSGAASGGRFKVTSTLDGKKVLPHRIHWVARPQIQTSKIAAVEFLIDGKKLWVEHHAPYYFGDDGNYLVTSFLRPGTHTFTVKAVTLGGTHATDTVKAKVLPAPAPPSAIAGNWTGYRPKGGPPAGNWQFQITSEGWEIIDTTGAGNRIDVAYLPGGIVEVRTGMATGHRKFDLNGWCNDAPGKLVRYRWSVNGNNLQLSYVSGTACSGFTAFITGPWKRAG